MGLDPLPRDQLHRVIGPPMQLVAPELLSERGRHGPDQHRPEAKVHTMAAAIELLDGFDPRDAVLVGDRYHDVEAGLAHGIATIGVTWGGFGDRAELEAAGAAAVVDTVDELATLLGL